MSELTPLVSAQHGAFFLVEPARTATTGAAARRLLRLPAARRRAGPLRARRGPRRPGRASSASRSSSTTSPRTTSRSPPASARRRRATSSCCRCSSRSRSSASSSWLVAAVQRDQPRVPRPDHRDDRRRAQHDHREHAHRGAAEQSQSLARELQSSRELQQTNDELRRRRLLPAEPRHRGQEREIELARAASRRRPTQLALSLEVQVGVPGQHEPRAAHAAELAADPVAAAGRQRRGNLTEPAGRVRHDDPRGRQRPARADQRHPRPVQGRGGQDGARPRRRSRSPTSARTSSARSGRSPRRRASTFAIELDDALPAVDRHRRAAPAAGAAQPAVQRLQVHPRRAR